MGLWELMFEAEVASLLHIPWRSICFHGALDLLPRPVFWDGPYMAKLATGY